MASRELIEGNLRNLASSTVSLGVDPANVLQESFGSRPLQVQTTPLEDSSFLVDLAHTGKTGRISSAKTLLEIAEMNGVALPYGCRQGCCGTCAIRLLHGEVQNAHVSSETTGFPGYRMLVKNKTEPWDQTVSRFISPEGLKDYWSALPSLH